MREQRGEFLRIRDGSQEALIAKRVLLSVQGQSPVTASLRQGLWSHICVPRQRQGHRAVPGRRNEHSWKYPVPPECRELSSSRTAGSSLGQLLT